MGFSIGTTRFLLRCHQSGVRFGSTLTLGRQHMLASPERIEAMMREFKAWPPPEGEEAFRRELRQTSWRFDLLLKAIGAKEVVSCDASQYEGASLVHDLNEPVPTEWENRHDAVIDGGTLEHVFNFPVAIANCMRLVKPGGHLLIFTPANNMCGHGFYQFSPELFYRVLSPENGFEVEEMAMFADATGFSRLLGLVEYPFPIATPTYAVKDPARIGKRVPLLNDKPSLVCVCAKKIESKKIFATTPQQSDYVPMWEEDHSQPTTPEPARGAGIIKWLQARLPESVCREWLPRLAFFVDPFRAEKNRRANSFANREFYRRLD